MIQFWVVGGEYTDTKFRTLVHGREEQWYGPYDDYDTAKAEWNKHAWKSVDDATTRFRIECIDPDDAPPCTD